MNRIEKVLEEREHLQDLLTKINTDLHLTTKKAVNELK